MRLHDPDPYESVAQDVLTQRRPLFVGVADGAAVYWDLYDRAFAIIDDEDVLTVELAETPFATPAAYCDQIGERRDWETGPRFGGSLVEDMIEAKQ